MMKFTIYPNLRIAPHQKANPYIHDFMDALNSHKDGKVINPPHKNPLLSLLPPKRWGDVFIFNWFENIPDYKYGMLQSVIAIVFLHIIRLCGKKVVWVLHNKKSHAGGYSRMKRFLTGLIARRSTLIITHATEGVEMIKKDYPFAAHKVHFLHHPTKNRLPEPLLPANQMEYDLLIWGHIARYKGIFEFVEYLKQHPDINLKVCIIGVCSPESLYDELIKAAPANVTVIHKSPSFEELGGYIAKSHFTLSPYSPESILSSGILMDSLSFGAKVIGPDVGSFKDYAKEPKLKAYTFKTFEDIAPIVKSRKDQPVSLKSYREFLEENNWEHFADSLMQLLH